MKDEDYKKNIDIYDKELDRIRDLLTQYDPTSKDYAQLCDVIKKLEESQLQEHRCYSEHCDAKKKQQEAELQAARLVIEQRNGMVPDWVPKLASILVTGGLGVMIYRGEMGGKVIGSTAVAMLNKLKF